MSETHEPIWPMRVWRTPWRDLVRLRVSARLDWKRTIVRSSLPEPIQLLLTKLVRKTRLWRLEKASIANELIAHFEDALVSGQSADEAAERFGDWKRSAKLIRRAAKRKRSYVWHAWRWSFWSAVALVGCYVGMGFYYAMGSPRITADYLPTINQKALAVPADERAWPMVRDALLALGAGESELYRLQVVYAEKSVYDLVVSQARPGDARWDEVVAFFDEHAEPVGQLHRAAEMPGLGYVAGYGFYEEDRALFWPNATDEAFAAEVVGAADETPMLWAVTTPHLGYMRGCVRLLGVEAFVAAERGDAARAYACLSAAFRYAQFSGEQNTIISQLVDISVRRLGLSLVSELLAGYPDLLSVEQLRDLTHEIAAVRSYDVDLTGERLHFLDTVQHVYTDDGSGNGHLDTVAYRRFVEEVTGKTTAFYDTRQRTGSEYLFDYALAPGATLYAADRKELVERGEYFYGLLERDFATPIWRQPHSLADQAIEDLASCGNKLQGFSKYGLLAQLLPSLGAVRNTSHNYMMHADATIAAIAVELYQREYGDYPETLDQLVPRYLPEVPIDRMTGGPMLYRVGVDGPVLYSVGAAGMTMVGLSSTTPTATATTA